MDNEITPQSIPDTNLASLVLNKYVNTPREDYLIYKNNDFKSSVDAEKFLTSEDFLKFWNRENVSKEGIGYRVKTSFNALDAMEGKLNNYGRRNYKVLIDERQDTVNRAMANFKPNLLNQHRPVIVDGIHMVGEDGRPLMTHIPEAEQIANYAKNMENGLNQIKNLARIENRFHTSYNNVILHSNTEGKGLSAYIDFAKLGQRSGHSGAGEGNFPIKMLMNENLPRYSLAGYEPFDGNFKGIDVHKAMEALDRNGGNAHLRYGTRLGATVSSSPKNEMFVPVGMANTARRVGNILPDGETIRIAGSASKIENALRFAGNVGKAAKPVMGVLNAVNTPLQIYDQISDANNSDKMISNYGGSDPLSLRAGMDLLLDSTGVGGSSLSEGLNKYNRLANDPRYIELNPVSSMVGQGLRGNPEYIKAFFNNLAYYGDKGGWVK
ncbi:hypothetical protein EB001_16360 [bacterium]|nr:hypothetical protein [bacterium]